MFYETSLEFLTPIVFGMIAGFVLDTLVANRLGIVFFLLFL